MSGPSHSNKAEEPRRPVGSPDNSVEAESTETSVIFRRGLRYRDEGEESPLEITLPLDDAILATIAAHRACPSISDRVVVLILHQALKNVADFAPDDEQTSGRLEMLTTNDSLIVRVTNSSSTPLPASLVGREITADTRAVRLPDAERSVKDRVIDSTGIEMMSEHLRWVLGDQSIADRKASIAWSQSDPSIAGELFLITFELKIPLPPEEDLTLSTSLNPRDEELMAIIDRSYEFFEAIKDHSDLSARSVQLGVKTCRELLSALLGREDHESKSGGRIEEFACEFLARIGRAAEEAVPELRECVVKQICPAKAALALSVVESDHTASVARFSAVLPALFLHDCETGEYSMAGILSYAQAVGSAASDIRDVLAQLAGHNGADFLMRMAERYNFVEDTPKDQRGRLRSSAYRLKNSRIRL